MHIKLVFQQWNYSNLKPNKTNIKQMTTYARESLQKLDTDNTTFHLSWSVRAFLANYNKFAFFKLNEVVEDINITNFQQKVYINELSTITTSFAYY